MSTPTPTEKMTMAVAIQTIRTVSKMMRAASDEKTAHTVCSLNWTLLEACCEVMTEEASRLSLVEAEYRLTASWALRHLAEEMAAGAAK